MKKVLLIEDNTDIRENMAEILELSGYKVVTATDGKEGVTAAVNEHPDVIVCDIMMPVLDGYGVIHMLQKNADTRNIPFIFLTAKAERDEIRKGMTLGADDYITKPFNGTELLDAIESRLHKNSVLKEDIGAGVEGLKNIVRHSGSGDMKQLIKDEGSLNSYKRKQVIYNEGNHAHRLYYVEKGKVKTYKTNDDGKELVIAIYNEGEFFGYVPILEHCVYRETAETMDDCEIATIPKDSFESLIYTHPDAMKKIVSLLASNISQREEQLLGLAYNSLRKKVANALITVYDKYKTPGSKASFTIEISRDNLATIAGTAKESLIRTLSDFKEEKLIDIIKGDIAILNEQKLKALVG
jgi:cAMP-binding proteins - catabolite gene activator and regulatory subunit of cAMP-dependent protein kinases